MGRTGIATLMDILAGMAPGGGWMHPMGGMHPPPTGMKIYAFYMVNLLRHVSFCACECYVPLTITCQTPPPKFSGAIPVVFHLITNKIIIPTYTGPLIVEVYRRHNASFVITCNMELYKLHNKEPAVCRGQVSSVVAPWVSGMIPTVCQDKLG